MSFLPRMLVLVAGMRKKRKTFARFRTALRVKHGRWNDSTNNGRRLLLPFVTLLPLPCTTAVFYFFLIFFSGLFFLTLRLICSRFFAFPCLTSPFALPCLRLPFLPLRGECKTYLCCSVSSNRRRNGTCKQEERPFGKRACRARQAQQPPKSRKIRQAVPWPSRP